VLKWPRFFGSRQEPNCDYQIQFSTCSVIKQASGLFSMWPSKRKLDQETSKHIGLAQQNGSSLAFFQRVVRQIKPF